MNGSASHDSDVVQTDVQRQTRRHHLAFCIGTSLMAAAGQVEAVIGVNAEPRSLEDISAPLSAVADESDATRARAA